MALRIPIGIPGTGKSYFMTRKLAASMIKDWRNKRLEAPHNVCSVEINDPDFRHYLRRNGCPTGWSHLTIFQKRDLRLRRFWLYRGINSQMEVKVQKVDGVLIHSFITPKGDTGV